MIPQATRAKATRAPMNVNDAPLPADRWDLYEVVQALRGGVRALLGGMLAGAAIAAALTWLLMPYVSEGMYGLGAIVNRDPLLPNQPTPWPKILQYGKGLSLPELKTEYPRLDGDSFRRFLVTRGIAADAALERAIRRLANPETRPEILNPQYGSTRADLREIGEQAKPVENTAVGMRIAASAREPEVAARTATLLGEFVGSAVFESQARGLIARRLEQYESQKLAFDNDMIVHRFNITTTSEKITRLRALQREFPEAGNRQVVSVAEGGSRYLTPSAQVVGLEATVADLRQQVTTTERWHRKAALLADYYRSAEAALGQGGDSRGVLQSLAALIDRTFPAAAEKTDDTLREARNDAALDIYALRTLREQGLRFVSGPTPGWRDESRVWKNAVGGAAAGLLLVALYATLVHLFRREALQRS
jgi:hypothetical protein